MRFIVALYFVALDSLGIFASRVLAATTMDDSNQRRKIAKTPFKVLDAPALQDDFYLNLVDWSSSNVLAVGLAACVYLWSACTSKVTKLCDLGSTDCVTSVAWNQRVRIFQACVDGQRLTHSYLVRERTCQSAPLLGKCRFGKSPHARRFAP